MKDTGYLSPIGNVGFPVLDNMPFHCFNQWFFCLFCGMGELAVQPVPFKEVAMCLASWRAGAVVTNITKAVLFLKRGDEKGDFRDFLGCFGVHLCQFHVQSTPVDKTAPARGIRIVNDNCQ